MKTRKNIIYTLLFITIFLSCNKSIDKENQVYNGIDSQILNIVDSMDGCFTEIPFVTIWFSYCSNSSDNAIRFFNSILIPPPDSLNNSKQSLISENNGFIGYKKYHDVYLVFLDYESNGMLDKFVKRDSLSFDEKPFTHFNIYDAEVNIDCIPREKIYLVNANDSLIIYNGKCMFDIE